MEPKPVKGRFVQYGCGLSCPDDWINFDASPTLLVQKIPIIGKYIRKAQISFPPGVRYGDIRKGLKIPDKSCDGVYASHILEHLALDDLDKAIKETIRILKPNGIFRLIVPDLFYYAKRYVESHELGDAESCSVFMQDTYLGKVSRPRGIFGLIKSSLSNSSHMWMWDEAGMTAVLKRHGFTHIRRAQFGDCSDSAFNLVEDVSRFQNACALECRQS